MKRRELDVFLDSISYIIYNLHEKLYITYNGGSMRTRCICCDSPFIYRNGDKDCTSILCSFCFEDKELKFKSSKWERLRFKILTRDKYICRYCGNSPMKDDNCTLHVDHVEAVSLGGSNGENNLLTSCARCNFGKMASPMPIDAKQVVDSYIATTKEIT